VVRSKEGTGVESKEKIKTEKDCRFFKICLTQEKNSKIFSAKEINSEIFQRKKKF